MKSVNSAKRWWASLAGVALLTGASGGAVGATPGPVGSVDPPDAERRASAVMVDADTAEKRNEVIGLGLDVTEHATSEGIEVVLHDQADRRVLREAGFSWKVRVPDLAKEAQQNRKADRVYAAQTADSGLPSGRTSYRHYQDYVDDLDMLAQRYPGLTRPVVLPERTTLGQDIIGLEISADAENVEDGKPVFAMFGAHHAREWPSSEHTIEFGFDLLQRYAAGDERARTILEEGRIVIVPVVNVDGFTVSREATPRGDFSQFDYEMKRKSCSLSETTPAQYRDGTCDDNSAGRLRGTDLNRNYPGFWGGGGASTTWFNDTFRGDGPGSEPEVTAVREFLSERAATVMISNHTYSNLVLRPPAIAATGKPVDEDVYKDLGDSMAEANQYTSQASYQLYDTSGSTEDWSYWIAGGLGFTFEINPDGFHPTYENAVVAEYLGLEPAAGAGMGGNQEAYLRAAEAAINPELHSTITGTAPAKHTIEVRKSHISPTSPVIQPNGTVGEPLLFEDTLTTRYASDGGPFVMAVNPSTRPLIADRDNAREPQGPPQESISLSNPDGIPGTRETESTTFEVLGLPDADNGKATLTFPWDGAADWDFFLYGPDGGLVGAGASLDNPEVITVSDPLPGTYELVVENYAGGSAASDWSGEVTFEGPTPPQNLLEAWTLSCYDKRGNAVNGSEIVIARGDQVNVGAACVRDKKGKRGD